MIEEYCITTGPPPMNESAAIPWELPDAVLYLILKVVELSTINIPLLLVPFFPVAVTWEIVGEEPPSTRRPVLMLGPSPVAVTLVIMGEDPTMYTPIVSEVPFAISAQFKLIQ